MNRTDPLPACHAPHLDAARGYAIALVVFIHTFGQFPRMTWPVKNLAVLGGHGVQLFFMLSAITLLSSWQRVARHDGREVGAFLVRRFFRIAPAFWLAAALYAWLLPAPGNVSRLLRVPDWLPAAPALSLADALPTLLFVDTLSPAWTKFSAGGWQVVPGSWSVSDEFMFYLLFPVLAGLALRPRALAALVLALLLIVPALGDEIRPWLVERHGEARARTFLDFWLPLHLPIFLAGFLLHAWFRDRAAFAQALPRTSGLLALIERHPVRAMAVAAALALARAQAAIVLPAAWVEGMERLLPSVHIHGMLLAVFVVALARRPHGILYGAAMQALGRISFSLYLCHWAVVELLWRTGWFDARAPDTEGVRQATLLLGLTLACAVPLAALTHRLVEQPFIALGGTIAQRLRRRGGRRTESVPKAGPAEAGPGGVDRLRPAAQD